METALGRFLVRLREISEAVLHATEAHELHTVLDGIASVARDVIGTRYAALGIPDGHGGLRYFRTSGLTPEEIARINHLPLGHGLIGAIMKERRVIRLDDLTRDPRSSGFPAHHPHMKSFLGVPVQAGVQLFGMLYLTDKHGAQPFNEMDELLAQTIASYAALAISGADVAAQSQQIRVLEERERIGMALHDGVIQSLYGIGMRVDVLKDAPGVRRGEVDMIIESLDEVIEDIRAFIGQLVQHRGVTLRSVLEQSLTRVAIPQTVQLSIDVPTVPLAMPQQAMESLGLIVREAVSNAVRHGRPSHVNIHAESSNGRLFINIYDNGCGFDIDAAAERAGKGGMGLPNMRRRAEELGGSLIVDSTQGEGTHVLLLLPVSGLRS